MNTINLGLDNGDLYAGCEIEEVGGRKNLTTALPQARDIVGKNATEIVKNMTDRNEITLTGPMAVWTYLIVFHIVVHKFTKVWYDDGRNAPLLVAAHG